MFLKSNYFILITIFVFIYQLVSCKVEDDLSSRNKNISEDSIMDSDRKLSKKLNYLPDSSVKIKEVENIL